MRGRSPNSGIPHSKPHINIDDYHNVIEVLKSGMIAEGKLVRRFEQAISDYLGLVGGVATGSGTDALFLALRALEIGVGHEVILPTYVCKSVMDAVLRTGATPVLCDVGPDWCMTLETVAPHINQSTKAIIVVHIFGIMANIQPLLDFGIPIIEDCCQALGVESGGIKAGSLGHFCISSFHATKLLTTGEGGMVLTHDSDLLERIKATKKGDHMMAGHRFPMSDLQAALGLSQFARYRGFLRRRCEIADRYFNQLRNLPIQLPLHIRNRSIFFRFPLRTDGDFDSLRSAFAAYNVQVRRGVDILLHRLNGGDDMGFEGAARAYNATLSLPIYPALTDLEVEQVVTAAHRVFA